MLNEILEEQLLGSQNILKVSVDTTQDLNLDSESISEWISIQKWILCFRVETKWGFNSFPYGSVANETKPLPLCCY